MSTFLDLAKLKKGTLFTLKKKRASPKLDKRYNYNVIIVGDAKISEN
jgi:hypothetical protein